MFVYSFLRINIPQSRHDRIELPARVGTFWQRQRLMTESVTRWLGAAASACGCLLSYFLIAACPFVARPWWAFAMFGSFVIYLGTSPGRKGIALSLFAGAVSFLVFRLSGRAVRWDIEGAITLPGAFAGAGCLFVLASAWLLARSKRAHKEAADSLLLCIALPASLILIDFVLLRRTTQFSFDRILLGCDGVLGVQPSYLVASVVQSYPAALRLCRLVYDALPLAIACAYVTCSPASAGTLARSLVVAGVVGRPLHFLVPAAGPKWALAGLFPTVVPMITADYMRPFELSAYFNCVPSLHLAWALLIFWQLRRKSAPALVISAAFLTCTAISTLALGEHYLIDLVIAFPFALTVEALCVGRLSAIAGSPRRIWAATVGCALFAGLTFIIRFGQFLRFSTVAGWALVAATLILSGFFEARLTDRDPERDGIHPGGLPFEDVESLNAT